MVFTKHLSLVLSQTFASRIGTATIFQLGEQKLAKNNQDNQIQNITLCKMYFSKKGIHDVPQKLGSFHKCLC